MNSRLAERKPRHRAGRLSTRLAALAALLALAATAAFLPSNTPAGAQTATSTLVSNTGQTARDNYTQVGFSGTSNWTMGGTFTTGSSPNGYTLSEVGLNMHDWQNNAANFTVSIWSTTASGAPDSQLHVLTHPVGKDQNAVNSFKAPMGARLDASTTYALVLAVSSGSVRVWMTDSDNEDDGAQSGWSIGDDRLQRQDQGTWGTGAQAPMFEVRGSEAAAPPGPEVSSASVDGKTLEIVFDENLDAASTPATDAFLVTARAERISITAIAIADATVTLTLGTAMQANWPVLVYYTQPSADALQNAGGEKTASFSRQAVTNNTGSGTPSISSVSLVSVPRRDTLNDGSKETYPRGQAIVVEVTWDQDVTWDVSADGAELRVRLQVGGTAAANRRLAKLVTGGADSGTARSLWFSYTVAQADGDANGITVAPANSGDLVLLASGATLKNAQGTQNAGRSHSGLGTQAGHQVDGQQTEPGNSAPTYNAAEPPGAIQAPSGTLVNLSVPFQDADGDPLRITLSAVNDVYTLDTPVHVDDRVYALVRANCVLANLTPAVTSPHSEVITVTATDPDGASVSETMTTVTEFVCPSLSSAEVNHKTLTLTLDGAPAAASHAPADEVLAAGEFTVKADSAVVAAEAVAVNGSTVTVTLAERVAPGASVTVSYAPGDYPAAVAFTDRPVTNNTLALGVQTAEAAYDGQATTLTLTFDRDLKPLGPLTWEQPDVHYAISVDGLYHSGTRRINLHTNRIQVSGPRLMLTIGGNEALPGKEVAVKYDYAWATNQRCPHPWGAACIESVLQYADGEDVAGFTATLTRPASGAIAPLLTAAQVAGDQLTLTFDAALDDNSAPAGNRFQVVHTAEDWHGSSSFVRGTGTAAVSGSTVTVTLASKVPQDRWAQVFYREGDDANPLRGARPSPSDPPGPEVGDIWLSRATVLDRDPPQQSGSLLAGKSLALYYDETLDTGSTPTTSAFTVMAGSNSVTVNSVSVHPNAVKLTLNSTPGQNVTVTYTPPGTNPVQDAAGNDAESLTSLTVIRQASNPAVSPFLTRASADGAVLTLTFSQQLDPAQVPDKTAFTLSLTELSQRISGGGPRTVTGVAVLGSTVELTMSPPYYPCGDPMTLTYTKPSANKLANLWGTEADAFSGTEVVNTRRDLCTWVVFTGQSGEEPGMMLRSNRALNRRSVLSKDAFTVTTRTPGGAPIEVTDVEMPEDADDLLALALSRRLADGERVDVHYRRPPGQPGLRDAEGRQIRDFSTEVTAPGAAAPTVTGIEVTSDPGGDATYVMGEVIRFRVAFSEPVEVTGTPLLGIDMDPAWWGRKNAVYAGGGGTAELTFTHTVVEPNVSTGGIAVLAGSLALDGGAIRSAATGADADLAHAGLGHDPAHRVDWRQNRPPAFGGAAQRLDSALPGFLVSLPMRQSDFSDPDGDPLTFTLSASRDDVYAADGEVPGGFLYNDGVGRVFFLAKTTCALAGLDPPTGDAYHTVITMTATDPDGATAQATATFRTDPETFACPSLSGATVNGAAVTLTFDADLAPSYAEPAAGEFVVQADGVAVGVTGVSLADGDAALDSDNLIGLTLASPVTAGQTVTVSYAPGGSAVAAAFAGRHAANHTPVVRYEPDPRLLADVRGYARETQHGYDHVLRWMRALHTFGALEEMTAAEAGGYADRYLAARWNPVVEELRKLEARDGHEPDERVVADVRGYARETGHGYDHVLRWMRVLRAFGALEEMTAAEARGYADQHLAARWDPVAAALAELEASTP